MLCFSFVLQAGTSLYISVMWPSAVWVSRELILKLGNLSQGLGPWLKTRALLNQGKTAYWATENKNSSLQPTFELNHRFGMCSVIHLRRLIKCGCTSVVKISYPMDSYQKKAVLAGVLTIQESVLHVYTRRKLSCLKISKQRRAATKSLSHLGRLRSLDCSMDSLPWECPKAAAGLWDQLSWGWCAPADIILEFLWVWEHSVTQRLPVGDRTREYFHSYWYLDTTLVLSLNAPCRAVSKLVWHCDLQRTAL